MSLFLELSATFMAFETKDKKCFIITITLHMLRIDFQLLESTNTAKAAPIDFWNFILIIKLHKKFS